MTAHTPMHDPLDPFVTQHVEALEGHPDFKILHRFVPPAAYNAGRPERLCRGIILDTEATGIDVKSDKIIELGMVSFEFCPDTGKVYRVLGAFNQLEDPGMPIPAAAGLVNGLTDEMVAGHKIDDVAALEFVQGADIIIAHKADYDRAMVERRFPFFDNIAWGCSLRQVDWAAEGLSAAKLDYIAFRLGFFFEGHRAEIDCRAALEALQRPLPKSGETGLTQLLRNYRRVDNRIWALDARFEKKDDLKARGYRWGDGTNGTEKAWYTDVPEEEFAAEAAWLKENIYYGRGFRLAVDTIDATNRFSARAGNRRTVMC